MKELHGASAFRVPAFVPNHHVLPGNDLAVNILLDIMLVWFTCALIVLCIVMYASRRAPKTNDPYGDFHLVLNKTSDDNGRPSTEWLNMGYWKVHDCSSFDVDVPV